MPELFIYGTLKDPKVIREVLGRETETKPATLNNWKVSSLEIDGEIFPVIIKNDGSSVHGFTTTITNEELEKLDEYETVAYKRIKVELAGGEIAETYIANNLNPKSKSKNSNPVI